MIDGKPIDQWLFGDNAKVAEHINPVPANNQLQTNPRPVINRKPDDVLNTIKRYQSVRLHDAKRTSR